MKTGIILVLFVGLGWAGWRLADVERQRYALLTGLCKIDATDLRSIDCLQNVEPRTSRLWDLYYGLTG
jgi:hypothetical protein